MRRILFILVALAGLLTVGISPAAAATPSIAVSYSAFSAVTNAPSACAVVVPDISYVIPVPDAVADEVSGVSRYGYHAISAGATQLVNSGAYPGQVLVANKTVTKSLYIPYLDTTVRVQVLPHEYHAFIPGYAGRSCSEWVHLVARG